MYIYVYNDTYVYVFIIYIYIYVLFVFSGGTGPLTTEKDHPNAPQRWPVQDPPEGAPTLVAQGHAHIPGFTSYPLVI